MTQVAPNSKTVVNNFCAEDLTSERKTLNITEDTNFNTFTFCIQEDGKPETQKGVLSTLNSLSTIQEWSHVSL